MSRLMSQTEIDREYGLRCRQCGHYDNAYGKGNLARWMPCSFVKAEDGREYTIRGLPQCQSLRMQEMGLTVMRTWVEKCDQCGRPAYSDRLLEASGA